MTCLKRNLEESNMGSDRDTIYIGKKPPMTYVLAVLTQFHNNCDEVILKARGRTISIAFDVAEIVRRRYLSDVKYAGSLEDTIKTEEVMRADESGKERKSYVTAVTIRLKR